MVAAGGAERRARPPARWGSGPGSLLRVDQRERLQRREEARRRLVRQRRLALGALLGALFLVVAGGFAVTGGGGGGGGGAEATADGDGEEARPPPPPQLPRGGRKIFPAFRVVGFYGAPQDDALGVLGIGRPEDAGRRLERQARAYKRGKRKVLPAMELISTVAAGAPGADGKYRYRQKPAVIRRYHRAARKMKALYVLDIQPGREDFMREVRALRTYLTEPDVSLAIDPEWSMKPGQLPGKQIGSTTAQKVNEVQRYMSRIIKDGNLPEKLLIVHQFTDDMIENREQLKRYPGVALVLNVDGFGGPEIKTQKYNDFTRGERRYQHGFKLFYEEDTNLMQPREVLRLKPRPDLVMYE